MRCLDQTLFGFLPPSSQTPGTSSVSHPTPAGNQMKKYIAIFLSFLALGLILGDVVHAQDTISSTSQTQQTAQSGADASNQGVKVSNEFNSAQLKHSTERLETAASAINGGFAAGFSNNNCANTTQATVQTFWLGAAFGKAVESETCNMRQNVQTIDQHAVTVMQITHDTSYSIKLLTVSLGQICNLNAQAAKDCKDQGLTK